jgi:hypothetical protein
MIARITDPSLPDARRRSIACVKLQPEAEHKRELCWVKNGNVRSQHEVKDYGDEYADPWIYTDIIVTMPTAPSRL